MAAISAQDTQLRAVQNALGALPFMTYAQATQLRKFVAEEGIADILELGFFHGVSSAYLATILQMNGGGHLTTIDRAVAREKRPNISQVLSGLGLSDMVTVYYEPRSYTWRLMKLIRQSGEHQFDFCYLDGGHSWDATGFAFFLVEKLLRPGGWILFDDLNWRYARLASRYRERRQITPEWLARMSNEEIQTPQIRRVWELLVKQHPSFCEFREEGSWGFARKRS